jgi:hypothetical protein
MCYRFHRCSRVAPLLGLLTLALAGPAAPMPAQPAPFLSLPLVRYEGVEVGTQNLLQLILLNLHARFFEVEANAPTPCFFEFQAQRGQEALIQGAGRVMETPDDVFGLGSVLAPVVGTRWTPNGLEPVKGHLLLPLQNGLIVPPQGSFFTVGAGEVSFGLQAVFWMAGAPEPCFLVGDVAGLTGEQP